MARRHRLSERCELFRPKRRSAVAAWPQRMILVVSGPQTNMERSLRNNLRHVREERQTVRRAKVAAALPAAARGRRDRPHRRLSPESYVYHSRRTPSERWLRNRLLAVNHRAAFDYIGAFNSGYNGRASRSASSARIRSTQQHQARAMPISTTICADEHKQRRSGKFRSRPGNRRCRRSIRRAVSHKANSHTPTISPLLRRHRGRYKMKGARRNSIHSKHRRSRLDLISSFISPTTQTTDAAEHRSRLPALRRARPRSGASAKPTQRSSK